MRALKVLAKVGLYSLPLQAALVCFADFYLRDRALAFGGWVIVTSWLIGFVAFAAGIVTTFTTRRFRWLGLSAATFVVGFISVWYFAGIGL